MNQIFFEYRMFLKIYFRKLPIFYLISATILLLGIPFLVNRSFPFIGMEEWNQEYYLLAIEIIFCLFSLIIGSELNCSKSLEKANEYFRQYKRRSISRNLLNLISGYAFLFFILVYLTLVSSLILVREIQGNFIYHFTYFLTLLLVKGWLLYTICQTIRTICTELKTFFIVILILATSNIYLFSLINDFSLSTQLFHLVSFITLDTKSFIGKFFPLEDQFSIQLLKSQTLFLIKILGPMFLILYSTKELIDQRKDTQIN